MGDEISGRGSVEVDAMEDLVSRLEEMESRRS